ncbi:MAG: polysaccharide biosynthesis/export family protein [Planctomycetota bacterium]|jgi:protein involved in polysaccharide export with SLBB domain
MMCIRTILAVFLVFLAISLTGCFSSRPEDIEAFLRPHEIEVTVKNYVLQPPDEIEVFCSKVPEIHLQRQQIRPDGKVSFEALGEIKAVGKTPGQLADVLQQKVSQLYTLAGDNPIDVRVAVYRSKTYYVLGEVGFPGPKVTTGRDTALRALAEARPTVLAWKDRIQVIRPSGDSSVEPKIFELNFNRMMAHGDMSKNVLLQEGDIIYVPPTVLAAIGQTIEEFVRPIGGVFSTAFTIQRVEAGPREGGGF